jgi:hypothetical protein
MIRIAVAGSDPAHLVWTSTASQLLERAPDQVAVLRAYIRQFGYIFPGEVAAVERHLPLLDEYITHDNTVVARFAKEEGRRLRGAIAKARQQESAWARDRDERFE